MSKVLKLYISHSEVDSFEVDDAGVVLDKNYGKDENRAILVTTTNSYEIAKQNGIEADFGALGENILIDVDIYHLKPTDRFKIGGALFEVTQNCTMCKSLAKIDSKLPKLLKNDRGIFVTLVSQKSKINLGDEVIVL